MKYEGTKELSSLSLMMKPTEGKKLVLDRLEFPVPPRESLRLELQRGLKEVAQLSATIPTECLLKYSGLERYNEQFYLIRKNNIKEGIEPFQTIDPESMVKFLLQIIKVIQHYHQQELVMGGLSLGQLKQDLSGRFYLQDPLVINYLSKSLAEEYKVDAPPEVIRGKSWDQKSDLFSWGVLAYRLLTGEDPFTAQTPEERLDKILNIGAVSPKDVKPELSDELSRLITNCLLTDPLKRPSLDDLSLNLTQLLEAGQLTASEAEVKDYQEKALTNRRHHQTKERFRFWFRKYGVVTLISSAAILFFVLTWMGSQSKPVITEKNRPAEVLAYYFKGVQTLDLSLVDQTLHKAKNNFADMVTNLYVMNKAQQGMTYSLKDNIKLNFVTLKIEPLKVDATQAKYKASYTLKVVLAKENQYIARVDTVTLKPVWKVWRITKIDILHEKRWAEKVVDQNNQGSEEGVKLPSASKASNKK